jgi:hypothetical protein
MLPDAVLPVPASLMTLLAVFAPLFTAPSFRTFTALACGFLAQPGKRTVCGMLTGAGLSRIWPHDRAHCFFSRARWNPGELGIAAAKLVISLLVPDGDPVEVLTGGTARVSGQDRRHNSCLLRLATSMFLFVTIVSAGSSRSGGAPVLPCGVSSRERGHPSWGSRRAQSVT